MGPAEAAAGGVGVVRVGDLLVTVTPLTLVEERALARLLRAEAEKHSADYFTRCAKLLQAMKAQPAAYLEAVREIVRLTATGPAVSDEQFVEFRASPAGLAHELYARGKKATPGLTREGLAAVVTDANCDDVGGQMVAVIEAGLPNA